MITLSLTVLFLPGAVTAESSMDGDTSVFLIDSCIPGNEYVLILLKPEANVGSFQDEDVLYVKQITATGRMIRACVVCPDADGSQVYVGGAFSNDAVSPRIIPKQQSFSVLRGATIIEEEAFSGTGITHLILADGIQTIEARAFADCDSLVFLSIPASVKMIADDALSGSPNVTIECVQGSFAQKFAEAHGIDTILTD